MDRNLACFLTIAGMVLVAVVAMGVMCWPDREESDVAKKAKKPEPPPLPEPKGETITATLEEPDPRIDDILAEQKRSAEVLAELAEIVKAWRAIDGAMVEAVVAVRERLDKLVEVARQDRTINLRMPDGRCATGQVPPRGAKLLP
jgi:hypothetical protein